MIDNKKILLTGATGFVGSALRACANRQGYDVIAISKDGGAGTLAYPFETTPSWRPILEGIHCVIHTAARVHVMNEHVSDPLAVYRAFNVKSTIELAEQAAECGVKRFIFLSSVKVNGESSIRPFNEFDSPCPRDPYAVSKYEAELALYDTASRTGLEIVVIRPPLVYGPGVRANFNSLMKLVAAGIPLPFASIDNKRSLIGVQNLVSFILECLSNPLAANQTFFVSDGVDLSINQLVSALAIAFGRSAKLFSIPESLMKWAGSLVGKRGAVDRLCGTLQVDISKSRDLLGWGPQVKLDEQLFDTVTEFLRVNPRFATEIPKGIV